MFQVKGAFAEFESRMAYQRVLAGLKWAVEEGKPSKSESAAICGPVRAFWRLPGNARSGLVRFSALREKSAR